MLVVAIQLEQKFFTRPVIEALIRIDQKIKNVLRPKSHTHPLSLSFLFRNNPDQIEVSTLKKQILAKKKSLPELEREFQKSYYRGWYLSEDQKSFLFALRPTAQSSAKERMFKRG